MNQDATTALIGTLMSMITPPAGTVDVMVDL